MRTCHLLRCRRGNTKTARVILLVCCTLHLVFFINYAFIIKKDTTQPQNILLVIDNAQQDTKAKSIESSNEPRFTTKQTNVANMNTTAKLVRGSTTSTKLPENCDVPGVIVDGVPWLVCTLKVNWMKGNWKKDPCYANYGVSDEACSMIKYLGEQEHHCPPDENIKPKLPPLYLEGQIAEPRKNFDQLFNELGSVLDYSWIKSRILRMESLWINNSNSLFTPDSPVRARKRIHLHLGLMSEGLGETAWNGGPLGELVQWSDLIAALYIMGHDIVITHTQTEVSYVYKDYINDWGRSSCPPDTLHNTTKVPFDLIYTDIHGLNVLRMAVGGSQFAVLECRVRTVDSFGTEASFNHPPYRLVKKISRTDYNGLDIYLQQFNTMFPHTPDNTFLGFVTEFAEKKETIPTSKPKRDIALVYGKQEIFWKGKQNYIDIIKEYVSEIHATVHEPQNLSPYIVNHGVVSAETLSALLRRTKIFVGLGFPFEGPAPLEAIQSGAVFLNPKFWRPISSLNHDFYQRKPTRRKITSQNPYAEKYIGKPYVYTVDTDDEKALREALQEIVDAPEPGSFLSYEFSVRGMLERVNTLVEKQQFCAKIPYSGPHAGTFEGLRWPPLSALNTLVGKEGYTCNDVCEAAGLICEPSFFPVLNRIEGFNRVGIVCKETKLPPTAESDYPAHNNGTCYLQTNAKLFSCAENYLNLHRLCPCRDYMPSQIALCKQFGLASGEHPQNEN